MVLLKVPLQDLVATCSNSDDVYVAGVWLVYGWYMGGIWAVYGGIWWYMGGIWVVYGRYMVVYGWYMGGIWVVYGWYMVYPLVIFR